MEHKEKCKKYYEEHKEQLKAYARKHYDSEYHKEYYKNNKAKIIEQIKKNKENKDGNYVYFLIDSLGNKIYIGSTTNLNTRLSCHLTGNSNMNITYNELVEKYNLNLILYKDFSNYELSRTELYYLEYICKQQYKEIIDNKVRINLNKISDERKRELQTLLDNTEYKVFNDEKYKKVS